MTTEPQNTVAADTAPEKETIEPSLMGIFAKARFHQIVKDLAGQTNLGHLFGRLQTRIAQRAVYERSRKGHPGYAARGLLGRS